MAPVFVICYPSTFKDFKGRFIDLLCKNDIIFVNRLLNGGE